MYFFQEIMLGDKQMNVKNVLVKNYINFKYHRLNTNVQAAAAIRIWLSKWYNVCSVLLTIPTTYTNQQ